MRTILIILIGVVVGFLWPRICTALKIKYSPLLNFIVLWAAFCIGDTWYGVTQAGYSLREEAIIHAVVFIVPVAAVLIYKKFFKKSATTP